MDVFRRILILGVFLKKSLFGESIHALDSVREISELKESKCNDPLGGFAEGNRPFMNLQNSSIFCPAFLLNKAL